MCSMRWWSCADSDETLYDLIARCTFVPGCYLSEWSANVRTVNERESWKKTISTFFISMNMKIYRGRQIVTSECIKHTLPPTQNMDLTHTHTHFPFSEQKIDNMNKLFDYCKLCSFCSFNPNNGQQHISCNFFRFFLSFFELFGINCRMFVVSRCSHEQRLDLHIENVRQKVAIVANNSIFTL